MVIAAVVGANWGDEGKGRIVDALAGEFDYVVRFQGGPNAGHTVINSLGRFVLNSLPSGVFHANVTNVIGPGVALDCEGFSRELAGLRERGVPTPNIVVSNRAGLLMPYHRLTDIWEEERLAERAYGSTRCGIAPHYGDRYEKRGLQVDDLFDARHFETRIERALEILNVRVEHAYGKPAFRASEVAAEQLRHAEWLGPLVGDTSTLLQRAFALGRSVVFEGQLGALRDPDLGIYPFVTSSSPLASFAMVGSGLPARALTRVIAVVKAYSSCVGAGPFVTELHGSAADELRTRGGDNGEFGRTTGRPRRVGHFDAVATRYGCRIQGATEVALTCLDVLGYLDKIAICTAYNGQVELPTTRKLQTVQPAYEWLPGWRQSLDNVERYEQLPDAARRYVERIEALIGVPIRRVSIGPKRDRLLERS